MDYGLQFLERAESLDCTLQFCSHPAEAVHTDIFAAHITRCPIHHCRSVSVEEVLSSRDTVQLTWIRCCSTNIAIKIFHNNHRLSSNSICSNFYYQNLARTRVFYIAYCTTIQRENEDNCSHVTCSNATHC